jgi:hypothetical protein
VCATYFQGKSYVLILEKTGWATLWAIFWQTHLVTLIPRYGLFFPAADDHCVTRVAWPCELKSLRCKWPFVSVGRDELFWDAAADLRKKWRRQLLRPVPELHIRNSKSWVVSCSKKKYFSYLWNGLAFIVSDSQFGNFSHKNGLRSWASTYNHYFYRFSQISVKKMATVLKIHVMIRCLLKLTLFWVKNADFLANIFFGKS